MARVRASEGAVDALYAEAPAGFTKARDALARSLAAAGDEQGAADVRARRKPSIVAYALNRIARAYPDDVAELVDVGRALARAQRKALRGDAADDLRATIARQRDVLRGLVRKAASLLGELNVAATHLPAVTAALQSALVDPAAGEALEAGRLDAVPDVTSDFLGDISGLPAPPRKRAPSRRAEPKSKPDPAATARAERVERERAAEEARAAKQRTAEIAATEARQEADAATDAAERAAAHATALAKRAKEADAAATRAEKAAQRASGR